MSITTANGRPFHVLPRRGSDRLFLVAQIGDPGDPNWTVEQLADALHDLADDLIRNDGSPAIRPLSLVPPPHADASDDAVRIDRAAHRVWVDGAEVFFTFQEFRLLEHLMRNRGRAIGRDELYTQAWQQTVAQGTRTVDVHIRRIRTKLGLYADSVETIRRVGYRFN